MNNNFALIIGVGADLPITVDDAIGIQQFLTDKDRCGYKEENVKLLIAENATKSKIIDGFDWLIANSSSDSTIFIYYSGHGIEYPHFALIPNNYNPLHFKKTTISEEIFSKKIEQLSTKKLIVTLDCCHAGGQLNLKNLPHSPYPKRVEQIFNNSSGRVLLASCRRDEKSYVGTPYSEFTKALLEGLCGYGAFEKDGYSRILDVIIWTARKVPERTNNKQNPIIKIKDLEDNFPIAFYSGGDTKFKKIDWKKGAEDIVNNYHSNHTGDYSEIIKNYQENLLLVETRMSEYIDFTSIPLQLIKTKKQIEQNIKRYESKK